MYIYKPMYIKLNILYKKKNKKFPHKTGKNSIEFRLIIMEKFKGKIETTNQPTPCGVIVLTVGKNSTKKVLRVKVWSISNTNN